MCGVKLTDLPNFNMEDAEVEVIEHPPAATERSAARRVAYKCYMKLIAATIRWVM